MGPLPPIEKPQIEFFQLFNFMASKIAPGVLIPLVACLFIARVSSICQNFRITINLKGYHIYNPRKETQLTKIQVKYKFRIQPESETEFGTDLPNLPQSFRKIWYQLSKDAFPRVACLRAFESLTKILKASCSRVDLSQSF